MNLSMLMCWPDYHLRLFACVLLFLCSPATAQTSPKSKPESQKYEDALDVSFGHDTGLKENQIVVRIISRAQPESEIALEKQNAKFTVTYLTLQKSLWLHLHESLPVPINSHLKTLEVNKTLVPIPTQDASLYASELKDIDLSSTSACVKTPGGKCIEMKDSTTYELLMNGGSTRIRVTDTSRSDFMSSENPRLLGWVLSLRRSVESALAYSTGKLIYAGDMANYKNTYLGVSYTLPSGLVTAPSGNVNNMTLPTLLQACKAPEPGQPKPCVVLIADYILNRPHTESPVGYLNKLASTVPSQGLKSLRPPTQQSYGGFLFARADFSKSEMGEPIFESEFVVFQKNFALGFIFTGATPSEIEDLANSLSTFRADDDRE